MMAGESIGCYELMILYPHLRDLRVDEVLVLVTFSQCYHLL